MNEGTHLGVKGTISHKASVPYTTPNCGLYLYLLVHTAKYFHPHILIKHLQLQSFFTLTGQASRIQAKMTVHAAQTEIPKYNSNFIL
jgi:hypothetical protein